MHNAQASGSDRVLRCTRRTSLCLLRGAAEWTRWIFACIDAANILAWSKPESDVVSSRIAPRKPYRWVLDFSIMMSVQDSGRYSVQFTALTDRLDSFISARLGREEMLIKEE